MSAPTMRQRWKRITPRSIQRDAPLIELPTSSTSSSMTIEAISIAELQRYQNSIGRRRVIIAIQNARKI